MNNLDKLSTAWKQVSEGSQQAISWVENTREQSQRLNNEADGINLELRRLRNMARKLGESSTHPVTTGFFGLSQAGKSYLISALAADTDGKLQTEFDGKLLDFVEHINPEGGGKEATGLVTRFSRTAKGGISGYPLELKIFSEIEIIKILINSFFNDFDKEKLDYTCDQTKINEVLKKVSNKVSNHYIGGINEDDVVDLQDYAMDNFGKSLSALKANYWAKATQLAPKLSIEDRATLFGILWGEFTEFNEVYQLFAKTLAKLGNPDKVYAPLTAVVKEKESGGLSKADSIMSVDMIERLNTSRDENINVCPVLTDSVGEPITISLAQLTALTAELVFPLINKTRVPVFENVDLLDFPGYRGRLNITSITSDNPVSQLLLRGKVAYLFERYTDSQEMNILIMCTPSNAQSEVNDVGPVLERWIARTQGETAQVRAGRKPGLLWAITKFDIRVQDKLGTTEENLKISWGSDGLLKQTILERFGNYEWFKNWSNNQPFNNMFLVRKPGFKVAFLNVENGKELSLNPAEQNQLDLMRKTFSQDPEIKIHVANPEAKWDAMLELNDGGMGYLSEYIESIAHPEVKQGRIIEQLNNAITAIEKRFESWYQSDGDQEVAKKRALAQEIVVELQKRAILIGELLLWLQLPQETIFSLYHSADLDEQDNQSEESPSQLENTSNFDMSLGFDDDFNLFDEPQSKAIESEIKDVVAPEIKSNFAQAVFKAWIEHLRSLSSNEEVMRFFKFNNDNKKIIDNLVDEIITAATRLKLQNSIAENVVKIEQSGYKRDQLVARQVFSIHTQIADFLAWLGYIAQPVNQRPASKAHQGQAIFESKPLELINNVPKLNDQTSNYMKSYLVDWFIAFANTCEQNAGHSAGREIDATQNAKLGEILRKFIDSKM